MTVRKKMASGVTLLAEAPLATPEDQVAASIRRQRLYLPLGRGSRGKSMWCQWYVGWRAEVGEKILAADIDRINHTLSDRVPGTTKYQDESDESIMETVRYTVETMLEEGVDGLIDSGAGDRVLLSVAQEMEFGTWLPSVGIDPVVVFILGADTQDLSIIEDFAKYKFTPAATILILNQAAVPKDMSPRDAFRATITGQDLFNHTVAGGAYTGQMPVLKAVLEMNKQGFSFQETIKNRSEETGGRALGMWRSQQVSQWEQQMMHSLRKARGWL